jgi:hypothetical protein
MGKANKIKSKAHDLRKNIDKHLLELTSVSVEQIRSRWAKTAEKLDIDQDLPSYLVGRILEKAKNVRESIQNEEGVQKAFGRAVKATNKAKATIVKNSPLKARRKKTTTTH